MAVFTSTKTNNAVAPVSFRIKDLMVGELLCQAGIVSDAQLLRFADLARAAQSSIGSALVFSNVLNSSELFVARRLVNRYLNDSDNPEKYIDELHKLLAKKSKAGTRHSSINLSKITRRHAQVGHQLFLVS
jgi:hypothetical protein